MQGYSSNFASTIMFSGSFLHSSQSSQEEMNSYSTLNKIKGWDYISETLTQWNIERSYACQNLRFKFKHHFSPNHQITYLMWIINAKQYLFYYFTLTLKLLINFYTQMEWNEIWVTSVTETFHIILVLSWFMSHIQICEKYT